MTTRTGRVVRACGLAITYFAVVIAAGHGIAPIALVLVAGRAPKWVLPMAVGWLGLAGLVCSVALPARHQRTTAIAAVALLSGSWLAFFALSQDKLGTTATSVPFLAAIAWTYREERSND